MYVEIVKPILCSRLLVTYTERPVYSPFYLPCFIVIMNVMI
jgi:hypothetical protein